MKNWTQSLVAAAVESSRSSDAEGMEDRELRFAPRPVRLEAGPSRMSDILASLLAELDIKIIPTDAGASQDERLAAAHESRLAARESEATRMEGTVRRHYPNLSHRRAVRSSRGEWWDSRRAASEALGVTESSIVGAIRDGGLCCGRRLHDASKGGRFLNPNPPKPVESDRGERWDSIQDAANALLVNRAAVQQAIRNGSRCRGRFLHASIVAASRATA